VFLTHLVRGGKLVLVPSRWDPHEALRLIQAERVGAMSGTPAMLWDLLKIADGYDLSSLSSMSIGGQATPVNLLRTMQERFPRLVFGTGYGSTETNGAVTMASGRDYTDRPHTGGRVLPLTQMRIRDESGADLPTGAVGDIWVRGPMVMAGYWNRPDATAAVMQPDGWFRVGDIGRLDEEEFITIVDRRTDMVISGGENIYCAEVERVLMEHAEIAEAATYGLPDERLGERLVASVVLHHGSALGAADVLQHVRQHLASYKVPSEVRLHDEPLPRTASGKINKVLLRAGPSA
jgi:acyl-CoA synthetase (AMP-forming)/AMP-acid ligase II